MKAMKTTKTMALLMLALALTSTVLAGNLKVNTAKSTVQWTGKKVTGEHTGTIGIKDGTLEVENSMLTGGKIVMDMNSIVDKDLTDPAWNAKLIGHLKSDDFFGVETYPTSELVITKVIGNAQNYTVSGNLTIKGITNPVTFKVTASADGKSYKGSMTIDRAKYNIKFRSKSFFENLGDNLIYDDFTLDFNIQLD